MNVDFETPYQCTNVSTFPALFCYVRMGSQRNDFQIIFKHVLFITNSAFSSYLVLFQCRLFGVNFCQPLGTLLLSTLVLILYQAQVSFLSQDNIDACVNQIRIDFVRLCTDFDFHILVGPLSCQSTPSRLIVLCETKRNETKRYFAKWYFAKRYFAKRYFAKWYFAKRYFAKWYFAKRLHKRQCA